MVVVLTLQLTLALLGYRIVIFVSATKDIPEKIVEVSKRGKKVVFSSPVSNRSRVYSFESILSVLFFSEKENKILRNFVNKLIT